MKAIKKQKKDIIKRGHDSMFSNKYFFFIF